MSKDKKTTEEPNLIDPGARRYRVMSDLIYAPDMGSRMAFWFHLPQMGVELTEDQKKDLLDRMHESMILHLQAMGLW